MSVLRVTFCIAVSAIVGGLCLPQNAEAIYRRPDRSDEPYQELGKQFPAVCRLGIGGSGTLIAPAWVLTHNHFGPENVPEPGGQIHFDDRSYSIKTVVRYPGWNMPSQVDLTLLELTSSVKGIDPIPIYVGNDELQNECKIVGYGWPGEILLGQTPRHGSEPYIPLRRAGTNIISRVSDKQVHTSIDLSQEVTDLEAAVSAADSGGALLIEKNGRVYLAGVNSGWIIGGDRDSLRRQNSEDLFARVSPFAPWIEKTTGHDFGARRWQKWGLRIGSIMLILGVIRYIQRRRKPAKVRDSEPMDTE